MNGVLEKVKACREKAEGLKAAKDWPGAAAAYEELARAWVAAAGMAGTASGREDRLKAHQAALDEASACRKKAKGAGGKGNSTGWGAGTSRTKADEAGAGGAAEEDEELEPCEPLDELLAKLDSLVGLDGVKRQVRSMLDLIAYRKKREDNSLTNPEMSHHLVFTGNPGTGKTTVARLIAKIYRSIGLLKRGQLVETDRSGLVAGYVGHTALKTKEIVGKALGGVLFIDEAYALAPKDAASNDFGTEAIEALLKEMEDHRDNLLVIVAGYPDLMEFFIQHTNPGLPSRFPLTIHFEDYSEEDLVRIFGSIAAKSDYKPTEECLESVRRHYRRVLSARPRDFANARDARNLFEATVVNQARRLSSVENPTVEQLKTLEAGDLPGEGTQGRS